MIEKGLVGKERSGPHSLVDCTRAECLRWIVNRGHPATVYVLPPVILVSYQARGRSVLVTRRASVRANMPRRFRPDVFEKDGMSRGGDLQPRAKINSVLLLSRKRPKKK